MGYGGRQSSRSGDIRRFNFTGNGSNTAFDLGFTPATQNQLIVTVNGLVQHYDAFSISGSTINFTGTPASGDTIQVTAVVDAVGVAAIPDGAIANVSTLAVSGAATLSNTFAVTGNATFSNTVAVTGNVTFSNTTAHTGVATFSNTVTIVGNTTFSNTTAHTGAATFSNTVAVTGNLSTTSQLLANGDIKGITATNPTIWSANSAALTDGSMYMQFNTTSSEGRLGSYTNHPLALMTNNTRRIIIDGSGRVTTPYQPAFWARKDDGNHTGDSVVVWNTAFLNRGSHYNTSTGRFTAPVGGVYCFFWRMRQSGSSGLNILWEKNDTAYQWQGTIDGDGRTAMGQITVELATNDTIRVVKYGGGMQGVADYHNLFSGYLLG